MYNTCSYTKFNYEGELEMLNDKNVNNAEVQPKEYSKAEIDSLKKFIEAVKNDESRSALACWGNHSDYSKGY